jgi:hypothetical protein
MRKERITKLNWKKETIFNTKIMMYFLYLASFVCVELFLRISASTCLCLKDVSMD